MMWRTLNSSHHQNKGTMDDKQYKLEKIRARQLARMMSALREIKTPRIIQDAVEKHFNFFYQDADTLINGIQDNDYRNIKK